MRMPFGKYKGFEVDELPDTYLEWLADKVDLRGQLKIDVRREFAARLRGKLPTRSGGAVLRIAAEDVELVRIVVDRGYRATAKVFHPDAGGDADMMARLNAVAESLRAQLTPLEAA